MTSGIEKRILSVKDWMENLDPESVFSIDMSVIDHTREKTEDHFALREHTGRRTVTITIKMGVQP